jgi:hypothetical protein
VRAAFERATRENVPVTGGAARFAWTLGTVDVCPLRWKSSPFALIPCARVEAGKLDANGIGVVPVRSVARGWLALAGVGRLRWSVLRSLSVDLEGGLRAPLIRDRFMFEPDITVYRPPSVSGFVEVGLLVTFL